MKESITQAAYDAVAPSRFLARLAGIMSAHGEPVERLSQMATEAACAEQDARTLNKLLGGDGDVA